MRFFSSSCLPFLALLVIFAGNSKLSSQFKRDLDGKQQMRWELTFCIFGLYFGQILIENSGQGALVPFGFCLSYFAKNQKVD